MSEQEDIVIIGEASNGSELFRLLSLTTADIILLDISMPDLSGIEICERLRTDYPQIKVLILSMYTTEEYIFNAIKAGAHGYLPKNISQPELLEAIRSISQGREYFNETISNIILKSYINKAKNAETENDIREHSLSKRELEVLRLFAEGFSNSEIGTRLFISPRTVESHKNHIMQKINLKSPVDLIKFAIKNHIVEI